MKQRITSISINPSAFTLAVMYALLSAVFAIAFVLFDIPREGGKALLFLLLPIAYFALGYVGFAVFVWLYNVIAPRTGGIEFTLGAASPGAYQPPGTAGAEGFRV